MNKLNGWQRIWVVIAIIWAVFVLPVAISLAPDSPARLSPERDNLLAKYPSFSPSFKKPVTHHPEGFDFTHLVPAEEYDRDLARFKELNNKIDSYPHDIAMDVLVSSLVWGSPIGRHLFAGHGRSLGKRRI